MSAALASHLQAADEGFLDQSHRILAYEPVHLDVAQREIVRRTIVDHCEIRGWLLHAANPRNTHVHGVVGADRKMVGRARQHQMD
jgi:hypothetical protein